MRALSSSLALSTKPTITSVKSKGFLTSVRAAAAPLPSSRRFTARYEESSARPGPRRIAYVTQCLLACRSLHFFFCAPSQSSSGISCRCSPPRIASLSATHSPCSSPADGCREVTAMLLIFVSVKSGGSGRARRRRDPVSRRRSCSEGRRVHT